MIKRILSAVGVCLLAVMLKAQPNCVLTHYSSEHGLSQNSIMSMAQDKNGNLWLSTWDGINRFDGYNFKVYKASMEDQLAMANNRVDVIRVDDHNMVWMQTYDGRVFRLNQTTEQFEQVLEGDDRCESLRLLPNGNVWLLLKGEGAVRLKTRPDDLQLVSENYAESREHGGIKGRVLDVFQDTKGREWLLTGNGLLKVEGEETASYFSRTDKRTKNTSQAFYAACCMNDTLYFASDRGRIWRYSLYDDIFKLWELPLTDKVISVNPLGDQLLVTTETKGVILYDPHTGHTRIFNRKNVPSFPTDAIHSVFVDSRQTAWFEMTEWGKVLRYNAETGHFKTFRMHVEPQGADRSYPAFHICEDTINGNLWVHPQGGGLSWYDREKDELIPFYNDPLSPDWRFSNKLHSMLVDRQGNLWFCTHSKGLEKATFYGRQFSLFPQTDEKSYDLNEQTVRALFEDDQHRIWMGKRDGKIEIYDGMFNYQGYLTTAGTIAKSGTPLDGVAYHIMQDSEGDIWIATKGRGVIHLHPQGERYAVTYYEYDEDDIYSLSHNSVYWLHEDNNHRIWVATFGGGLNYMERSVDGGYVFINSRNNLKGFPIDQCYRLRHITSDTEGNIWVGSSDGVLCFKENFKSPESIEFHHYVLDPTDTRSLSSNNVYHILCTKRGDVYMATFGGGLNKVERMDEEGNVAFKVYSKADGLHSDILLSVEEDVDGNLWMSTENGLSKFLVEEQRFENYNERDFGKEVRFEESASLCLCNNSVAFGTANGVLYFSPSGIEKSHYVPSIYLSDLKIANKEVPLGQEGSVLMKTLNETEHLVLSHKQNFITVSYAALDFVYPENIRYAFLLDGFDKEWIYVDRQRSATYTNLQAGTYTFRVRSTNSDGVWVDNERVLKITVRPSFWETPLAIVGYVVAAALVILIVVYILFTIYRLKNEVSIEQQVSDIKLRFFTDISHELRTPLTLIAGPVEYILKNERLPEEFRAQLQVVERNTDRMLRLVNQILDFRKIQKNKMKLRVEKIDVVPFVRRIMESFESLAEDHHIDFVFESETPSLPLWVDADKLEKIVFNLLSNAFKYTPQGKMITLFVHENEDNVAIGVQDQGIGIPENKKASIFLRFENLIDKNLFNQQSTGIGLSLVKELVELHRAAIRVDSKVGEGSCFTVEFLKGKEHYAEDVELIVSDDVEVTDAGGLSAMEMNEKAEEALLGQSERKTLLLVEDNLELRFFLRSIFASQYDVIEATNGVEGLDKAMKFIPDVIISDIMMPEKDGLILTRELRADMATSHIPIVLLTAKTDWESKLQGVEEGADDYITKPFSATYLKAKVENLMARRSRMQHLYRANLMSEEVMTDEGEGEDSSSEMSSQDRKFMESLLEAMERNMDNGKLVVDDLVNELSVSRSVFFKKLKMLTGMAPIEFVKEMRVKRAAQLIETGDYTMSQITYMVGFNDPRYFSKCFKQHYGMTPTEYREENNVTKNK